ncbi:MAG: glycosyltransferase family 1 protein [Myxococcota bacterium]
MTAPRLLLDARMVGPQVHGIARYVVCLARALKRVAPDWRPALLLARNAPPELRDEFTHAVSPVPFLHPAEPATLPAVVERLRMPLFHATSFACSPLLRKPFVITLHDAIHLERRGDYGLAQAAYYQLVVRPAALRADAVITVSHDARQKLTDHLGLPSERIQVIHNGVELEQFGQPSDAPRHGPVLTVTGPKPHKNLVTLLHALRHAPSLVLEVAGRPQDGLEQVATGLGLGERVRFLGPVDQPTLMQKLAEASAVAVPSLTEGFGLPALEGMAAGCPVVLSDIAVFHEVAGDCAVYAPPLDPLAWAQALTSLLGDPSRCRELSRAGRERAEQFTWDRTATQTAQVYDAVIQRRSPFS